MSSKKSGASNAAVDAMSTEQAYQAAMASSSKDPIFYAGVVRKLIAAGRPDLATGVYNYAKELGINTAVIEQVMSATAAPAEAQGSSTGTPVEAGMPLALKQQMATILGALGVDPTTGIITVTPDAEAVSAATLLAAQLEAQGYTQAATSLRVYAKQAAALVASSTPSAVTPSAQSVIPASLLDTVNKALQMESDPRRLRAIAAQLRALPNSSDPIIQMLIGQLEQKASIAESQLVVAATTQEIDTIINQPDAASPAQSQAVAAPVSAKTAAARAMVANLKAVQSQYGFPGCKTKGDVSLIKAFQSAAGQNPDGKAGPGTLVEAARAGVCDLPFVQQWPVGSSKQKVYTYRDALRAMGAALGEPCKSQLEASATRERGQAGVSGGLA
jgi:hypothetical protein